MLEFQEQLRALQAQVAELRQQRPAKLEPQEHQLQDLRSRTPHTTQGSYALVQGAAQEVQEEDELPENLFTYCMAQLTMNPGSVVETLAYLICQQGIQLMLLFSFLCGSTGEFIDQYWTSPPSTPELCMYEGKVSFRHAHQDIAAALVCLFLAAMTMMADDKDHLASIYPCETSPLSVRAVAACAWCVQSFVLPWLLTLTIPVLLSTSMDACDVVMNGLAITFIIEIDDLLYACVPRSRRSRLKSEFALMGSAHSCLRMDLTQVEVITWGLMGSKFVIMMSIYLSNLMLASNYTGDMLPKTTAGNTATGNIMFDAVNEFGWVVQFLALPLLHSFAWRKPSDAFAAIATICRGVFVAIFGLFIPGLGLFFLHSRVLGFNIYDVNLWIGCFNQTYKWSGPPGGIVTQKSPG